MILQIKAEEACFAQNVYKYIKIQGVSKIQAATSIVHVKILWKVILLLTCAASLLSYGLLKM